MRYFFWLLCIPFFSHAGTVRLINNSPYDLRAVIRGSDGSDLGELIVKTQKETVWTDSYGQFGMYGGANANINSYYTTKTPYAVLWYCLDGEDYAMCDTVSTGALVMAQGCMGARMCKAQKKGPGNLLQRPPPAPPLTQ